MNKQGTYRTSREIPWGIQRQTTDYVGSPNSVIKLAYQAGMIDDEICWHDALKARNNVVHSYSDEIALQIIKDAQERFLPMFVELQRNIEDNWL